MKPTRTLPVACSIVALTAVMYGCANNRDGPPAPPGPTALDGVREDATAAAASAMAAAGNADRAAGGAEAATTHLVPLQTGATAKLRAAEARRQARLAMTEARKAGYAQDAAAAATDPPRAAGWAIVAEDARTAAQRHAAMAADVAMQAREAARTELRIDGTVMRVGDRSIDAASRSTTVTGPGPVITGVIAHLNPTATSDAVAGQAFAVARADDPATAADETAAGAAYRQAAAARTFAIGTTLDSADDAARLMLVTHYTGIAAAVYAPPPVAGPQVTGTKAGYVSIDDPATAGIVETDNVALRSEGRFVPAGAADGELVHTDRVAADARPVEVFSYVDPADRTRKYATLRSTLFVHSSGETTWTYASGADITAPAAGGADPDAGRGPRQVRGSIPGAVAYRHLHFGVWAGLGEVAGDGAQPVADLGIGFVRSIGRALTGADMPSAGRARYEGSWVAAVRQASGTGAGALSLTSGDAVLKAHFGDGAITVGLDGLATLEGSIDGSTFAGAEATVGAAGTHGLTVGGAFTGAFRGGFYGARAAEAGGVFDFTSAGMRAGAFRGAFGGSRR